jgi:hypothetical protein
MGLSIPGELREVAPVTHPRAHKTIDRPLADMIYSGPNADNELRESTV